MEGSRLDAQELISLAAEKKLLRPLLLQVDKDFKRANIQLDGFVHCEVGEVERSLREKIYFLLMERFDDYLNLMYMVDVPEKAFRDLEITDVVGVSEQVTLLILRREWQKVCYRNSYEDGGH